MMKLIPFGYGAPKAQERLEKIMAEDERALIVDIRYEARSRMPQWNKGALQKRWGERYWPLSALGNVNYNNGHSIKLSMPEIGIPLLVEALSKGCTLVLLCVCPSYDYCHRKKVVELVKAELPEVEVIDAR